MVSQGQTTYHFEAGPGDAGQRLDRWLTTCLPELSRSRVQSLIRDGAASSDAGPLSCSDRVTPGLTVTVAIPEARPVDIVAQDIPLDIVYEDEHIVAVNKPPGLVVHPAPGHHDGTLVNALLHHCKDLAGVGDKRRPGIVHRLDRDTSGLILVAKDEQSMLGLARQFHDHEVGKRYAALVHGVPMVVSGAIETEIGRSRHDRKKMSTRPVSGAREALTLYEVEEIVLGGSLLRVRIETGRTHQIRVHMAHIRCPVMGDEQYGNPKRDRQLPVPPQRQMLHAQRLQFKHPVTGKRMTLKTTLPDDFEQMLASLREGGCRAACS